MGRYTVFMGTTHRHGRRACFQKDNPAFNADTRLFSKHIEIGRPLPRIEPRYGPCLIALLIGGATMLSASGCYKPLLSPEEERSQYDRYDAIRAQRAPAFIEDEFGRRRPNLRGRLLEKQ